VIFLGIKSTQIPSAPAPPTPPKGSQPAAVEPGPPTSPRQPEFLLEKKPEKCWIFGNKKIMVISIAPSSPEMRSHRNWRFHQ